VIHVTGEESISEALAIAPFVNALLLDSGNQSLAVKELGGTGRVHDWQISVKIREFLAGGFKVENVQAAVNQVHPYALDVCSGVRTDGKLDEEKLRAFFKQLSIMNH
jgi:phosphoribosylanthranilate isomerase